MQTFCAGLWIRLIDLDILVDMTNSPTCSYCSKYFDQNEKVSKFIDIIQNILWISGIFFALSSYN